jgi:hypothetical protein
VEAGADRRRDRRRDRDDDEEGGEGKLDTTGLASSEPSHHAKDRCPRSGKRKRERSDDATDSEEDDRDDRSRSPSEPDRRKKSSSRRKSHDHRKRSKDKRERRSDRRKKKKSSRRGSRRRRESSSSSGVSDSDSDTSGGDSSGDDTTSASESGGGRVERQKVVNERLLAKLRARGETLEERKERRARKRAERISSRFGYTNEDNPFNDSSLNETFVWQKKKQQQPKLKSEKGGRSADGEAATSKHDSSMNTLEEIEKVRQRRKERELQFEEMERIRAEESRMKELEHYDDWARKEEEFHLLQQQQRSAIRLVEGREKPIDVLAKNVLLYGLSDEEKLNRGGATVKYKERFNAMEALENLDALLDEPQPLLRMLKREELQELLVDIDAFRALEREASALLHPSRALGAPNPVLRYWDALYVVAVDEIKFLQTGGAGGSHAKMVEQVQKIFKGQSQQALQEMQLEVRGRIRRNATFDGEGGAFDRSYWTSVDEQLTVSLAKMDLAEIHNQMLVRQLERLEKRREELAKRPARAERDLPDDVERDQQASLGVPSNVEPGFGDVEEDLGVAQEVEIQAMTKKYSWHDKYRPRKPRYFNRVKTGYDWNKYNQTHYDRDNPPPKVVQGYKFNIFYPDLIDPTKTPQFHLEPADSDEFCIIRFRAGPPYEDVAFKIINREWNKSRKQGFKSTFERGVLSLYFNFTTHWYRR